MLTPLRGRIVLATVGMASLVAVAPQAQGKGATPITTCGQTVTTSAVVTQDLVCTAHGIIVGASGITIDLKGFTIRGDRSPGHYGVDDIGGFDNVTTTNGVLRNFEAGLNATNSADNVSVSNLTASGNSIHGINVAGKSASIKAVTASGNGTIGVLVVGDSAAIQSSTASGNGSDGVYILGNDAVIRSVTAVANDFGIAVGGDSASIQSSNASGNHSAGFDLSGNEAAIRSVTASANGYNGIEILGDAASLKANHADANGFSATGASDLDGIGIYVGGFTTPPVGANTARGNDNPAECEPTALC